jgi:hypothetical protein
MNSSANIPEVAEIDIYALREDMNMIFDVVMHRRPLTRDL